MNKKKVISIFLFFVTLILLITTFYLNSLLQNNQEESVTKIKKTKASSQTYHRYLALNITLPTITGNSFYSSSSSLAPSNIVKSISPQPTHQINLPTGRTNDSSSNSSQRPITISPSPSISPTVIPTIALPTASVLSSASSVSSQGLIAYKNPTLIPSNIRTTNNSSSILISPSTKLTVTSSISKKLPETGMVQYSSILFIVAVTTIFIAFLY